MKSLYPRGGYTIIEVMIFLFVSAALFGSIVTGIGQQNRRVEFSQSVRELETKLQDVLNDVDTGYFPSSGNITCTVSGAGSPVSSNGGNEQGTNQDCIFVGKAIQFASHEGGPSQVDIYTVVGRRNDVATEQAVTNIEQAKPVVMDFQIDRLNLRGDLQITRVLLGNGSAPTQAGGLAVLSSFGSGAGDSSGSVKTVLANVDISPSVNASSAIFKAGVEGLNSVNNIPQAANGMVICLQEGGSGSGGRRAAVTVGQNSQRLGLETLIDPVLAGCPPA